MQHGSQLPAVYQVPNVCLQPSLLGEYMFETVRRLHLCLLTKMEGNLLLLLNLKVQAWKLNKVVPRLHFLWPCELCGQHTVSFAFS